MTDQASLDELDVLNSPQSPTTDSEPDQGGGGKAGQSVPVASPGGSADASGSSEECPAHRDSSSVTTQGVD